MTNVEYTPAEPCEDAIISAGMLADRLRPLVLASCDQGETGTSCLNGGQFIPLHRGTVSAIYQHLERIAAWDRESTIFALEQELADINARQSERAKEISEKLSNRRALLRGGKSL